MTRRTAQQREPLARIDAALLGMRRITDAPSGLPFLDHGGKRIEMSTMLVVDAVSRAGDGPTSVGDIARLISVAPSTASRLVDRAVAAGMVERRRADDDPRRAALGLTPDGEELQAAAVRFRTQMLTGLLSGWSSHDIDTFARLLERFSQALQHEPHPDHGRTP